MTEKERKSRQKIVNEYVNNKNKYILNNELRIISKLWIFSELDGLEAKNIIILFTHTFTDVCFRFSLSLL